MQALLNKLTIRRRIKKYPLEHKLDTLYYPHRDSVVLNVCDCKQCCCCLLIVLLLLQVACGVSPRGWPLSLGARGVVLHLGELDASLLRSRDCYLCVRVPDNQPPQVRGRSEVHNSSNKC